MRDIIGRAVLRALALAGILAGTLALLGVLFRQDRATGIMVGIGALGGGLAMLRVLHNSTRAT